MEAHLFDSKMKIEYKKLIQTIKDNKFIVTEVDNPVHTYIKFIFASLD